jgi:deazaflavin-dependent oxidoreductase (nitroreductase family)
VERKTVSDANPELTFAGVAEMARDVRSADGPGQFTRDFNVAAIEAFRSNGGKIPGELWDADILLLSARGAKTGTVRTVPVGYFLVDDRLLVVASMGGAPKNPPWFHNLVANPVVTVELGRETFSATAAVVDEPERTTLFAEIARQSPLFGGYQRKTTRPIPVIELHRTPAAAGDVDVR